MCLILFAWETHPDYRLILAANRDEFYHRPAKPLDFWPDQPNLLAGRDLQAGGTWMGLTRNGRLAAITNYREPASAQANAPSRGELVQNFLSSDMRPEAYLNEIKTNGNRYNGFNLLVGNLDSLWYYGNRAPAIQRIQPGIHGLSNHLLDTPWPKVSTGKAGLQRILATNSGSPDDLENALFHMLSDQTRPPDAALPDTGIGPSWERLLSPLFITSDIYGTRNSSLILIDRAYRATFIEKTYTYEKQGVLTANRKRFHFKLESRSVL